MTSKSYSDYSQQELQFLTQGVMSYLDGWEFTNDQIVTVLGLADEIKSRQLQNFREGTKVFSDSEKLMSRVEHIIGIADALRTQFPYSEQMRLLWFQKPHRRFGRKTPLQIMLDNESTDGLLKVRMEVDCNYAYAISEAMRKNSQKQS